MQVEWYGQSAFRLTDGATTVFIDPFGDMTPMLDQRHALGLPRDRRRQGDLLLVTHEHVDHNGVEAVDGDPVTLRSTAGRLESPIGEVRGVASDLSTTSSPAPSAVPLRCPCSPSQDDA